MVRILLSTRLGERRWSQADLARMTGIRPNTISELYNEVATRISLEHLDLICEALDCDLSDLIVRIPNKEPQVKTRTGAPRSKGKDCPCFLTPDVKASGAFLCLFQIRNRLRI